MTVRDILNKNPAITAGATLLAILVAVGSTAYLGGMGASRSLSLPSYSYFTTDDGKTYFKDDANKVPPFRMADGKEAVQALVYRCKGGKGPFVGFLLRYTPEGKGKLEAYVEKQKAAGKSGLLLDAASSDVIAATQEVKRPGGATWVKMNEAQQYQQVTSVRCPDNQSGELTPVVPD